MGLRTGLALVSSFVFVGYGIYCLTSAAMEREFLRYGLPNLRVLTGWLEILGGMGLVVGLWWPPGFRLSSGGLALLMVCAVITRIRIGDPLPWSLPAIILLLLNAALFFDSLRTRA
ncbi:MAG: DoxX family protein [Planctomycetes bacterium]|nr:DoxX family protein [Planctomycetota bacterium]